ncbi:MAG: hypothetical protein RIC95_11205 [Vicingaceae bacterium]
MERAIRKRHLPTYLPTYSAALFCKRKTDIFLEAEVLFGDDNNEE